MRRQNLLVLKSLFLGVLFVIIGFAISYLYYHQVYTTAMWQSLPYPSDVRDHIVFAKSIAFDPSYYLSRFFEPGFHLLLISLVKISGISFNNGAIIILTLAYLIFVFMLLHIITVAMEALQNKGYKIYFTTTNKSFFGRIKWQISLNENFYLLLCLLLLLTSFIYVPLVSRNVHSGIGSPNVWHSPTLTMVKPFALYITYQVIFQLQKLEINYKYYLQSFLLFVSCLMKPCFAEVFIPSLFIYVGIIALQKKQINSIFYVLGLVLPTLILLGSQFFVWHGEQTIIFSAYSVIKSYNQSALLAFLQALAFPLVVAFTVGKSMSRHLRFAWLLVVVSYLQFALLAETGSAFIYADFRWGFDVALTLIFLFSILDFLRWVFTDGSLARRDKRARIKLVVLIFSLHLFSGIAFAYNVFTGGYFWAIVNP